MKVHILFIKKEDCGICEMMHGAWNRIKEERPEWSYDEVELSTESGPLLFYENKKYTDLHYFPVFFIFINNEYKKRFVGGMRYKALIKAIEGVIEECQ